MKYLGILCLVLSVSVIFADEKEESTESGETDEVLTRCKRPLGLCMMFCENGHKTDEHGCPQCDCLDDPCKPEDRSQIACPSKDGVNYMCKSKPTCTEHPCTSMDHKCVEMPMCAMPMCADRCEHGYRYDEFGCMTCDCKESACEGHECPESHICLPASGGLGDRAATALCLHEAHKQDFEDKYPDHDMTGEEFPQLCEFKRQLNTHLAKKAEDEDMPKEEREHMIHPVDCHKNGTFKPLQCHMTLKTCWCVNDLGMELPGTKVKFESRTDIPECVPHETVRVEMTMVMVHDFEDVNPHLKMIKVAVSSYMSKWLEVDEEYIEIQEVLPHNEETNLVQIHMVIKHDGKTDLAYVTERFRFTVRQTPHVIMCHGIKMHVDPKSVTMNHISKPKHWDDDDGKTGAHSSEERDDDSDEDDDDEDYSTKCARIWREHKGVVIVAGLGIGVFLCVILGIVITACRSRKSARASAQFKHQKMDKYKENLAYQNEIMGHPDLCEDKEKMKVISVMITDEDAKPAEKY